jgi:hypothetical protein
LLGVLALAGCSLFSKSSDVERAVSRNLPPIQLPPDAIQLDIVHAEWPIGDSMLGPSLWRQVDQLAALEPETRAMLKQNGFRVGITGSNPPVALQKVLRLRSDFAYEPAAEKEKQLVGRRVVVRSGGYTQIESSATYPQCELKIEDRHGMGSRQFENARCQWRVGVKRLQDGWAQLEFVPQVHYGKMFHRTVAGAEGWRYENSQRVETFFPQRFSLRLSVGDMAVLTIEENADGSLGNLFFSGPSVLQSQEGGSGPFNEIPTVEQRPGNDEPVQRLLVVRLAGMKAPAAQGSNP